MSLDHFGVRSKDVFEVWCVCHVTQTLFDLQLARPQGIETETNCSLLSETQIHELRIISGGNASSGEE